MFHSREIHITVSPVVFFLTQQRSLLLVFVLQIHFISFVILFNNSIESLDVFLTHWPTCTHTHTHHLQSSLMDLHLNLCLNRQICRCVKASRDKAADDKQVSVRESECVLGRMFVRFHAFVCHSVGRVWPEAVLVSTHTPECTNDCLCSQ